MSLPRGVPRRTGAPEREEGHHGTIGGGYASETGIDRPQGAPAPEPPVPRISLTFSGLPPADWQTIVTRERGVARQTLGREARIEGSSSLIDGVPDDRAQRH